MRVFSLLLAILLVGCSSSTISTNTALVPATGRVPIQVQAVPLAAQTGCTASFVAHDLDHTTTVPARIARMFEGNGAGVAIDDLDGDALPEIVLANSHSPNTILWNLGGLRFRTEHMPQGDTRAVNIVDVNADNLPDLVFTRRLAAPLFLRNTGDPQQRFVQETLPNVARPAYAMAWGDLNGDTILDLVTASYDAELLTSQGNNFLMGPGAGVYVYTRRENSVEVQRLANKSQALAITLFDQNNDGQPDIGIGNDFALPDMYWQHQNGTWTTVQPFQATSHSTMGFDQGDIDNRGQEALFSSDMKPYDKSVANLARWQPMMLEMWSPPPLGDPQIMENVLQIRDAQGQLHNQAYERSIDATGWSWSGVFGDLDNDGWLDLYVVNGMIETELFNYLPGGELVEQNQALRNDRTGHYLAMPAWGLGSTRSGRGMAMADLDNDGDLDIVVNNVSTPAQLFENQLCSGISLELELYWPKSMNSRAIGATLILHTSTGDYLRSVRASAGYLSGSSARQHIAFQAGTILHQIEIRWPDGAISAVDQPQAEQLLKITREK